MSYLAKRYASALLETGCPEAQLTAAASCILDQPLLWDALRCPVIHLSEKNAVLQALPPFADAPVLLRFLHLLLENGRITLLPDIVEEFHQMSLLQKQAAECLVTCCQIPDDALQQRLRQALCRLHNKSEVQLVFHIDPTLLGGFILQLDGLTYDQSIRGRLLGLSRHLNEVNAI